MPKRGKDLTDKFQLEKWLNMTTDLPVLNLTCLKNPSGECALVAESCVNCRNRDIILKHAAAHQKATNYYEKQMSLSADFSLIASYKLLQHRAEGARDAVLKLTE